MKVNLSNKEKRLDPDASDGLEPHESHDAVPLNEPVHPLESTNRYIPPTGSFE
eukprot:CAMPEP_0171485272 /NCGR_PEP_ID=MMETSP0958-20121227/449_1 /TAXON_ID=87120 /ORGANISM="Aurantiochytrium limacinum, Strain ATCCMYA-1381" /LENGTH=52 /DNA_ID=CAMNT_0012018035 /DNA_START=335 /DNA_END=493 /DNA_ORIENTATION=+